jgi:ABC-type uncharacterized transport system auxiliary subunit
MKISRPFFVACSCAAVLAAGCATIPIKQYFVLNYKPQDMARRISPAAYPFTVRLKDLDIEDAYSRPQLVYRQSPFQLEYYSYKLWAVKPSRMITDLIQKHLVSVGLMSHIVRRFDEGLAPDYEIGGSIESLEEYDSEKIWFAHIALWLRLARLSDGKTLYARHFDKRKRVFSNEPQDVVKAMSEIMEYIMNQACIDMDGILARELGVAQAAGAADSALVDTSQTGIENAQ